MRNTIRSYATGSNTFNGGDFKLLAEVGITVGAADGANVSTSNLDTLTIDENKLMQALEENPESVKALLTGENSIFGMMEKTISNSLSATTGYFDVKTKTLEKNISNMNDKISRQNSSITAYRASLEKKFQAMEQAIAAMQQNYQSFLS